ncbi:MAG: double zinc ribbon domain-containing protein [Armatimonadota bacterium]
MDNTIDLNKSLSLGLQDALNARLVPGENIAISLPGSFGEAFAVSNKRAFVIRDCDSGPCAACRVFDYLLSKVTGADVASSGTGGYIELKLSEPIADPEEARVYFPSYDLSAFQTAASYVAKIIASQSSPAAAAQMTGAAVGEACPKCGATLDDFSTFCGACGEQLRQVCSECSGSSPVGAKHCSHCGREMFAFNPNCSKCGARVLRWMRYCTDCGSVLEQVCVACGMSVQPRWTHCANCGRLLGSDRLDSRAAVAVQRRLQELGASEAERKRPSPPVSEPEPTPSSASNMVAEDYNKRGLKFFEEGELEQAVREFKMAVELEPSNTSYHCNLAVAYDENDEDDLAFAEYFKTLELDPKDLTALLSLGYMYNEHDERDKAEEVWNKVIAIAPDSAEAQEVQENLRHQDQL